MNLYELAMMHEINEDLKYIWCLTDEMNQDECDQFMRQSGRTYLENIGDMLGFMIGDIEKIRGKDNE